MEIREAVSFYHLRVKFVTLQELLTNNMRSLIRDSNKISKHSRLIKTSVKFELSCTVRMYIHTYISTYIHIHTYIQTYVYTYIHNQIHINTYVPQVELC